METRRIGEIDGLRAIAVSTVVANHLFGDWFAGGFLGVDMFFAISGFVITRSLLGDGNQGLRLGLVDFYARRFRRLAPAFLLVSAVTIIATICLVSLPSESLHTGAAALLGASNIQLHALAVDYFAPSSDLNLFRHTWSLGVETQYYLLFPLMLLAACAIGRGMLGIALLLAIFTFASFAAAWMHGGLGYSAKAAFYLLPFRFWELGAGCLAYAISLRHLPPLPRPVPNLLTAIACLVLLWVFLAVPSHIPAAQAATVLATITLILFGRGETLAGKILMLGPVIYLGLISYPLYLWHWPLISLSHWLTVTTPIGKILLIAAALCLAAATHQWIEKPWMRASAFRRPWLGLSLYPASVLLLGGLCLLGSAAASLPSFLPAAMARASLAEDPPAFLPLSGSGLPYNPSCVVDAARPFRIKKLELCTTRPKGPDRRTVWTVGDSHAGHLQGMLHKLHDLDGTGFHLIETPGVAFPTRPGQGSKDRERIFQFILANAKAGDVLLIARLFMKRNATHEPMADIGNWSREVAKLAAQLRERGLLVVIMGPPPIFNFKTIQACILSKQACTAERSRIEGSAGAVMEQLRAKLANHGNVAVFDPLPILCPQPETHCAARIGGKRAYRDADHLNSHGAALLAAPFREFMTRQNSAD